MSTNPHGIPVNAVRDTAYYTEEPVSTSEWFWTILLMAIPVVNLVLLLVWAFGSSAKISKRNFSRASLLWAVISIGISVFISIVAGSWMAMVLRSVPLQ